ncbi:MAG TPA: glycosyltransferase family 4 protein [Nocardioidaceae bacterium]|nr:glycosyltransferase family 4 protein [Nocardioidaceae bacterium]
MRVGLVCPYSLDVPGGVQGHVLGLAAALRVLGHDVSVLAPGEALDDHVVSLGRSVPLPYKGAVGRVTFGPATAARVGRWLDRGDFDVVHVHEPLTPSASLLAVRASTAPVVATFHTAQDRPRALAASASVLRPWLSRIDAHVAVSEEAARTARKYLPVHPDIVPNGLDVASYTGPRSPDGRTVLFLGRIDDQRKGLDVLLRHWPAVRAQVPDARLLVAGPGRRGSVPAGVTLLGELTEDAKRDALRSADVLVAPNTHGESFGLVLTEAMAAGTPVVAHSLPAFRAVLGEGRFGTLYRRDPAVPIVVALTEPEHVAALARAATDEVHRYDWSTVAPQLLEVYESVVDPERAAS